MTLYWPTIGQLKCILAIAPSPSNVKFAYQTASQILHEILIVIHYFRSSPSPLYSNSLHSPLYHPGRVLMLPSLCMCFSLSVC